METLIEDINYNEHFMNLSSTSYELPEWLEHLRPFKCIIGAGDWTGDEYMMQKFDIMICNPFERSWGDEQIVQLRKNLEYIDQNFYHQKIIVNMDFNDPKDRENFVETFGKSFESIYLNHHVPVDPKNLHLLSELPLMLIRGGVFDLTRGIKGFGGPILVNNYTNFESLLTSQNIPSVRFYGPNKNELEERAISQLMEMISNFPYDGLYIYRPGYPLDQSVRITLETYFSVIDENNYKRFDELMDIYFILKNTDFVNQVNNLYDFETPLLIGELRPDFVLVCQG